MKLSISYLRQIINEELEAELQEKKKKKQQKGKKRAAKVAKRKNKKIKADKHFSPSQSPAQADRTFHNCIVSVEKDVDPRGNDTKKQAAAKICTKNARQEKGATLDWGSARRREVEKARPGGLSGYEDPLPRKVRHKTHIAKENNK